MASIVKRGADIVVSAWALLMSPFLRAVANHREALPGFQKVSDRYGFQLRPIHYYEPTYRECDLPAVTDVCRNLPGLRMNTAGQLALLAECQFQAELTEIAKTKASVASFGYDNPMYGIGDAEMLYNLIRLKRPKRIYEIGCGQSTLMARLAIARNASLDPAYACEQICVEPYEAEWLEQVGVTVLRQRVETVDLELFDKLEAGDILFIDSSHVIRPWGDVLREFHEIIPRLAPGVIVQVHDIFTPRDYPEAWLRGQRRLWNEQYLLESFLAFNDEFEVICAANWLKHNHQEAFFAACPMMLTRPDKEPGAFWFQRKAR